MALNKFPLALTLMPDAAVLVRWRMGDGATLAMAANLGPEPATIASPGGKLLFATSDKAIAGGTLAARSTAVFLEPAT